MADPQGHLSPVAAGKGGPASSQGPGAQLPEIPALTSGHPNGKGKPRLQMHQKLQADPGRTKQANHEARGRPPPRPLPWGLQFGMRTSPQKKDAEKRSRSLRGARAGGPGGQGCRGRHRPSTQMRTYTRSPGAPSGPRLCFPGRCQAGGSVVWGWAGAGHLRSGGARVGHGSQGWRGWSPPLPSQPSRGLFSEAVAVRAPEG